MGRYFLNLEVKRLKRNQILRDIVRPALMLIILIVCGLMLTVWQQYRLAMDEKQQLELSGGPIVTRVPRSQVIRHREKIAVQPIASEPMSIPPSDKTPVISHITTSEPVVFLTIDDGVHKDQAMADFMIERELPITAFLTVDAIKNDFNYFERLADGGTSIQNHTVTHPHLPKHPYDSQKNEICSTSDTLEGKYGQRPKLFRPPYGEFNDDTLRAAAACGIKATVRWNVVVQNKALNYQETPGLKPGDIILLHYKPELKDDLEATLRSIHEQGYKIGQLEDWIQ